MVTYIPMGEAMGISKDQETGEVALRVGPYYTIDASGCAGWLRGLDDGYDVMSGMCNLRRGDG